MYRHWIDPSIPFSNVVLKPSHGAMITSATLRDRLSDTQNPDIEWHSAEIRTGDAAGEESRAQHPHRASGRYGVGQSRPTGYRASAAACHRSG